jgi:ectoine hydroxylase-related dioxygenase (phytanoyl-CoA dioxygenase family)
MILSDQQIQEYKTNGYLILNDIYDDDLSFEFCKILSKIINSFNIKDISIKNLDKINKIEATEIVLDTLNKLETLDHKYIKILYDTVRNTDLLNRMANSQKILLSVSQLMGYKNKIPLYLKQIACRIDMPKDTTFSLDWHQEAHYSIKGSDFIQLWAPALNDINKINGSIKVLESSNNAGVVETDDYVPEIGHAQYKPKQKIIDQFNEKQVELKFGQVLLFSNTLIHKSGDNSSNLPRLTLLAHYHNPLNQKFLEAMGEKKTDPPSKNTYK